MTSLANEPETGDSPQESIQLSIAATVRLKIVDEMGQSFGTGTIIDVHDDEALVLTCGHIFRDSEGRGRVLCDSFAPGARSEIQGKLISYDVRRDIGLVSFRPGVPVKPAKVGGIGLRPEQDQQVFTIGCNRGADPTVIQNKVLAVNRYHGPPNLVVGGRPVDGRSGGGLFTVDGTLIGVCNAADPEYDEGLYAALGNIHAELDEVGLGFIYRQQFPSIARGESRIPSNVRQDTNTRDIQPTSASTVATNAARGVSDPFRAATTRAQDQQRSQPRSPELVASIRSQTDPTDRRELVIERPSRSLLDQLNREATQRGPHQQTQLHIPRATITNQSPQSDGEWRPLAPN